MAARAFKLGPDTPSAAEFKDHFIRGARIPVIHSARRCCRRPLCPKSLSKTRYRPDPQMILLRYLLDLGKPASNVHRQAEVRRRVLNVGGGGKERPILPHYGNWRHGLLDIDPAGRHDIVCDARELHTLAASQYDAVYCSHNLGRCYEHNGLEVLSGFLLPSGGNCRSRNEICLAYRSHNRRGVSQSRIRNNR